MKRSISMVALSGVACLALFGCSHPQPTATMAPPVAQQMGGAPVNGGMNGTMNGGNGGGMAQGGVYNWQDVPAGQQVGIARAQFDQGGYQLVTDNGDTIVVPFANNNLYVMRFGRTNGQTYFVNEGGVPTLYVAPNYGLANASAQGALWYPLPSNFNYSQPVYVGIAPSWNAFMGMGWYPGMSVYGGMWGYHSYGMAWMPGFNIFIGGHPYNGWNSYYTYYNHNPGYIRTTYVNRSYYSTPLRGTGSYHYTGSYRSTGSFGSGTRSTGSFGSTRSTGSFGSGTRSTGSFGSGTRTTGSFGSGSSTRPAGSFGSGSGTTTRPSGSFNGGSSGFTPRSSSGSSFGSGSSGSGSSFGGGSTRPSGSSSFGGGSSRPSGSSSFGGGGTRSSGSFGGRRR